MDYWGICNHEKLKYHNAYIIGPQLAIWSFRHFLISESFTILPLPAYKCLVFVWSKNVCECYLIYLLFLWQPSLIFCLFSLTSSFNNRYLAGDARWKSEAQAQRAEIKLLEEVTDNILIFHWRQIRNPFCSNFRKQPMTSCLQLGLNHWILFALRIFEQNWLMTQHHWHQWRHARKEVDSPFLKTTTAIFFIKRALLHDFYSKFLCLRQICILTHFVTFGRHSKFLPTHEWAIKIHLTKSAFSLLPSFNWRQNMTPQLIRKLFIPW